MTSSLLFVSSDHPNVQMLVLAAPRLAFLDAPPRDGGEISLKTKLISAGFAPKNHYRETVHTEHYVQSSI